MSASLAARIIVPIPINDEILAILVVVFVAAALLYGVRRSSEDRNARAFRLRMDRHEKTEAARRVAKERAEADRLATDPVYAAAVGAATAAAHERAAFIVAASALYEAANEELDAFCDAVDDDDAYLTWMDTDDNASGAFDSALATLHSLNFYPSPYPGLSAGRIEALSNSFGDSVTAYKSALRSALDAAMAAKTDSKAAYAVRVREPSQHAG